MTFLHERALACVISFFLGVVAGKLGTVIYLVLKWDRENR